MDGWVGGWVGGWMGGWMDGWMDGRTDGWMDGWVCSSASSLAMEDRCLHEGGALRSDMFLVFQFLGEKSAQILGGWRKVNMCVAAHF